MSSPHAQTRYQVRFDHGHDGAARIAEGADAVVWADAIPGGATQPHASSAPGAAQLVAGPGSAAATAAWLLQLQVDLGRRAMIAIVAVGGEDGRPAVEDQLLAGAVVDELMALGIDATSPEAALVGAAATTLRGAYAHLLSASVSGQERAALGEGDAVIAAARAVGGQPTVLAEHPERAGA